MTWKGRNLSEPQDRVHLVVQGYAPQRLDHYLGQALNWRSRSRLQSIIREGRVTVNGAAAKPSRRVRQGDEITLELSMGTGLPTDYRDRELHYIYEDRWLVAVNKPPGLLVHPVGRHVYDTLMNYLHHRYRSVDADSAEDQPAESEATAERRVTSRMRKRLAARQRREAVDEVVPRLCHRIDRDTTGVLLVAKNAAVHKEITQQFERRTVQKEYVCLVEGSFPKDSEAISIPIGEGRCLSTCLEHPVLKASRTTVRVLERYRDNTLLGCSPHTGRQNQIRVHLAARGYPIVGDTRFGANPAPESFPARFLLHSAKLRFYHVRLKAWVELEGDLPADFSALIAKLR